jgi:urate oxidase
MAAILTQHSYGKARIRLTRVTRHGDWHDVRDLTLAIALEGEFATSYTEGDNRLVIPTDTMKNVVYALARDCPLDAIECFGIALADLFLDQHAHVAAATVEIAERALDRIETGGRTHPDAFCGTRSERRTSGVRRDRAGLRVESGLDDLFLLRTGGSAFAGFLRDRYTTLPDVADRLFATVLEAGWTYRAPGNGFDWNRAHGEVRAALLATFAAHQSLSVQHTLHAMGAAAIEACAELEEITLVMPNQHRLLVDLEPFGRDNPGVVFVPTDEPQGVIKGTLRRGSRSSS